ncbi:8062_t:CDS:2, partial [Cetraspora pellucida]
MKSSCYKIPPLLVNSIYREEFMNLKGAIGRNGDDRVISLSSRYGFTGTSFTTVST